MPNGPELEVELLTLLLISQFIMFISVTSMRFGCHNFEKVVTLHLGTCLNDDGFGFVGSTACCEEGFGTMGNYSSWSIIWRTCSSCHHPL
jgi:hypothetical protein